jgi:hypothetical protein
MVRPATYDDVRLFKLRAEKRRAAHDWCGDGFKAKTLEETTQAATSGVLHEYLFFESGYELAIGWEKVPDTVPAVRERFKNPLYLENLEEAAKRYEAYATLAALVRG